MKRPGLSERVRKPPRFFTIEPYLRKGDNPVSSHPKARYPRLVPLVVFDHGSLWARIKQMRFISRQLVGSIFEMLKSARSIRSNPRTGKTHLDPKTQGELEAFAHALGVSEIGYAVVKPQFIFQGLRILYPNAIVFTMEMDGDKIKSSPSTVSLVEIFRTYHQLGVVVNKVAGFLRQRGYNAHAGPAVGGDVAYIPLAREAGLGEVGKNGLLVTRGHGPRVRLAAVYTDIENLPFAKAPSMGWVQSYCDMCNICVERCPADAFFAEPRVLEDGELAFIDHTKCAVPFSNDAGCTLCIKHCPFSYQNHDKLHAAIERQRPIPP